MHNCLSKNTSNGGEHEKAKIAIIYLAVLLASCAPQAAEPSSGTGSGAGTALGNDVFFTLFANVIYRTGTGKSPEEEARELKQIVMEHAR